MKTVYYLCLFVGVIGILVYFYNLSNEYKVTIDDSKAIEFYGDHKNHYKIKSLNYDKLKIYYNREVFDGCYNGSFLECNKYKNPGNTLDFPNKFLNEGDDGKFLLGCLVKENWQYSDCFCVHSDIQACEGYIKE